MKSATDSLDRWSGRALLLAALVAAAALSLFPLRNYDIWHHMKFGQYVVEHRRVPLEELFSYTGRPQWVNPAWLAGVVFYLAHAAGGVNALILFKAALVVAAAAVMLRSARNAGASPAACAAAAALALYAMRVRLICRPLIFSVLLLAVVNHVLREFAARRSNRLWLLPLLTLLWANLHAGFVLVFALLPIYLLGELRAPGSEARRLRRARALAACAALCLLAALANPYGYRTLLLPFSVTTHAPLTLTNEWQGMRFSLRFFLPGHPAFLHSFAFFWIIAGLLVVCAAATWRNLTLTDGLTALLFIVMTIGSRRHVALFGVAAFPVLAKHLGLAAPRAVGARVRPGPATAAAGRLALAAALAWAGFNLRFGFERPGVRLGVQPYTYPVKAADFIQANRLPGRMLNYWSWGPYFIWRFFPRRKVYADGRFSAYPDQVFEDWLVMNEGRPGWRELTKKYGVNFAVVAPSPRLPGQFDDPGWKLVYWDDLCVIYLRDAPANRALIARYECGLTHPAKFLQRLADPRLAPALERQLRAKLAQDPACVTAHGNLAKLLIKEGRLREAAAHLEQAVALQPWSLSLRHDLGVCYLRLGRPKDAARVFEALTRMPCFPTQRALAYLRLGDAQRLLGRRARAYACYRRAAQRLPNNPDVQAGLAATRPRR